MECYKRRWSVICEGDVGSAWEWCQIIVHTSCDVPAPLNRLKTTVVDDSGSIFAPTVVSSPEGLHFFGGVKLYTISRGAEHNSESQQRYFDCLDLEKFI